MSDYNGWEVAFFVMGALWLIEKAIDAYLWRVLVRQTERSQALLERVVAPPSPAAPETQT